jgi:hypothetical protein
MPEYRIYTLLRANEIAGPPTELQCASDQEAIAEAKKLLDGFDLEIWQDARVVTRLQPSDAR